MENELGSGVRNLYRDVRIYSNAEPSDHAPDARGVD